MQRSVPGRSASKRRWVLIVLVYKFAFMANYSADAQSTASLALASTGSGFVVGPGGDVVTNAHVIHDCGEIRVRSHIAGSVVSTVAAIDRNNDLALLRLPTSLGEYAVFRDGPTVRLGDSILALGFPLQGILTSHVTLTTGVITSLSGLRDDTRYLQISAPVQAGNSGGPLLDQSGRVVGVVVAKLDAIKVAKLIGDLPQNVNFAINGSLVRAFLDAGRVQYRTMAAKSLMSSADIADKAAKYTVSIECWRKTTEQSANVEQALAAERRKIEAQRRALEAERKTLEAMRQVPTRANEDPQAAAVKKIWLLAAEESKVLDVTRDTLMVSTMLCKDLVAPQGICKTENSYKSNAKVRFRDVRDVYFRTGDSVQPVASMWVRGADVQFSPLSGPRPDEFTIRLYVTDSWKLNELKAALEELVGRALR